MGKHSNAGIITAIGTTSVLSLVMALPIVLAAGALRPTNSEAMLGLNTDDIPAIAATAYVDAATAAQSFDPPCAIPAPVLAAVGKIESGHGTSGGAIVGPDGVASPPIVGPALPKLGGDTDDGKWDGSASVDHAVGPMQFIPSTWHSMGRDGNGDGVVDPHNIFDATLASAAYLCHEGSPMASEQDWRRGLLAYNHSTKYVDEVLALAETYRPTAEHVAADGPSGVALVSVPGVGRTNARWATDVQRMLEAANADGIQLTGGSFRDPAEQIALRRSHCGSSQYAIYEMPASRCSPPTARPGTSNHEKGLAIDFHNCSSRSTRCYRWLSANAHRFGIINLPLEPWHWSINGR